MNYSCTLLLMDVIIQQDRKGSILLTLEGKKENRDAVHKMVYFNTCTTTGSEQGTMLND